MSRPFSYTQARMGLQYALTMGLPAIGYDEGDGKGYAIDWLASWPTEPVTFANTLKAALNDASFRRAVRDFDEQYPEVDLMAGLLEECADLADETFAI